MRFAIFLALLAQAAAFVPQTGGRASTALGAAFGKKVKYVPALPISEVPKPGSATSVVVAGLAVCIAVDESGSVYALGDKCPPINQPLSFGKVKDGTIDDPFFGTKFSVKTGDVVGQWCPSLIGKVLGGLFEPVGVVTFPVRKSGGTLQVQVDVNAKANFEAGYWKGILDAQGKSDGTYY